MSALLLPLLAACTQTGLVLTDGPARDTADPVGHDTGSTTEDLPDNPDTDTTEPGELTDEEIFEAFFDISVIQQIDIELTDRVIQQLNRGYEGYLAGDVTINGVRYDDVGVQLKGSSTYMDLDCGDGYCKAGFKIKLDEFVEDQKLGDLQRITLNNMSSDYTQSKEVIVYDLLHRNGQLASRANYARVTLNGEPWGLYTNVESADDEWIQRRFADDSGNFWGTASTYGDFLREYIDAGGWVLKSGDGDMTRIEQVTAALDRFGGDFEGELGPYINVDQFLEYWSWCAAVGNYDGYPFVINDVLIYEDPADGGRLVFAPWGTDESWSEYEYTGQSWNIVSSRLGAACLADQACVAALTAKIAVAVDAYDQSDVLGTAEAFWDLSQTDVQSDPKRPFGAEYVWYYRDYYAGVMPAYGDYVRGKVGL